LTTNDRDTRLRARVYKSKQQQTGPKLEMAPNKGVGRKKQKVKDKDMLQRSSDQPKSMVIRIGAQDVGASVSQLVQDVRHCLEPDTAIRLKERRANKLKDFLVMAGPLGVTHLLLFSRSESGNVNVSRSVITCPRLD
jgi:ribosome biogenesis protein SSF1/2